MITASIAAWILFTVCATSATDTGSRLSSIDVVTVVLRHPAEWSADQSKHAATNWTVFSVTPRHFNVYGSVGLAARPGACRRLALVDPVHSSAFDLPDSLSRKA